MKKTQLEDYFERTLRHKEQEHAAALRHAHEQTEHASAALHSERKALAQAKNDVIDEKNRSKVLSEHLQTVTQMLQESRDLEAIAQVQPGYSVIQVLHRVGTLPQENLKDAVQSEVKKLKQVIANQKIKYEKVLGDAAGVAAAQFAEVKDCRRIEMETIYAKLKDVLQRKNCTIGRYIFNLLAGNIMILLGFHHDNQRCRLQMSLDEAHGHMSVYEQGISLEKMKVLEQIRW